MLKALFQKNEARSGRIYLDYASLTPIHPDVLHEIATYSSPEYANPSSLYKEAVASKKALEDARTRIAKCIRAHADEIIFTSGGTEANNLAILGAVEALKSQGMEYKDMHVVTSVIEHSSVRECMNFLNDREVAVDVVEVDAMGLVNLDDLRKKIKPNTVIVSIMTVNNEIGSIQPIREIAKIIRQARKNAPEGGPFSFQSEAEYPLFHTDAAQAPLYMELNTENLGADLMTLDGSKMYGPRGIGFLYKKRNVPLAHIIHGGGQEDGLRSGTEPLPQIMGLTKAFEMAVASRESEKARIEELRAFFIEKLRSLRKGVRIQGEQIATQIPHILNVSFPRIDNEFFVFQLDAKGIACSTKSSCLRDEEESYVLKAVGADSKASVRFSFGSATTREDLEHVASVIGKILGASKVA
jgi:cysteine desulfurase